MGPPSTVHFSTARAEKKNPTQSNPTTADRSNTETVAQLRISVPSPTTTTSFLFAMFARAAIPAFRAASRRAFSTQAAAVQSGSAARRFMGAAAVAAGGAATYSAFFAPSVHLEGAKTIAGELGTPSGTYPTWFVLPSVLVLIRNLPLKTQRGATS